MKIEMLPVVGREQITPTVYALHIKSAYLSETIYPGQFVNIKVNERRYPLLRRPFSVARKEGEVITIIFETVGEGTEILSQKKSGDMLDVLGPLGKPFKMPLSGETALLVAGGLGMAPMPLLTQSLKEKGIERIHTFLGARSAGQLVDYKLTDVRYATDDNSKGHHGTVVSLVEMWLNDNKGEQCMVYGCGPNPMLRALQELVKFSSVNGQVSLECVMACGIGICQGCPVETRNDTQKYRLVCKDGPVFNINSVVIP